MSADACEPYGCDGSGRSKQGWSANYGDQYGPCGRPCERMTPDAPHKTDWLKQARRVGWVGREGESK